MRHSGFSLVEISIVLVILGLLVGGVLVGKTLIHASELRAITTEYSRYKTATYAFRDKYLALPGDITNAQTIWGVLHATPSTCNTTVATSTATCNGDGDGIIGISDGLGYEPFRFWQHLANAGLIEGTYSGTATGWNIVLGTNVPPSKIQNAGWCVRYQDANPGGGRFFDAVRPTQYFTFGISDPSDPCEGSSLTPEDAWNIDGKLDDGMPNGGTVIAGQRTICTTSSGTGDTAATYKVTSSNIACFLMLRLH